MAAPRELRRHAFQALYQIDARNGGDIDDVRRAIDDIEDLRAAERDRVFALASSAWDHRTDADTAMLRFAPEWPAHRQPVVDRSILRLAYYEMTRGGVPPKTVINEAVNLAKSFSTERSPAFINALLDKIMKDLPGQPAEAAASHNDAASSEPVPAPTPTEE